MKLKLIALVLVVACAGRLKAQSDTTYHLHHFLPDSAQFTTCYDGVVYSIAGDTLINDKKMKKVYNPNQYYAAIYEDTLNAKYYVVYEGETEAKLFMDFSVKEGDEIHLPYSYDVKLAVDEVYFHESGRKVVKVRSNIKVAFWVEGVGNLWPVLFTNVADFVLFKESSESPLAKVLVGDSIVYEQISDADCKSSEPYSSIKANYTNIDISIYPNPAHDRLLIDSKTFECISYEIVSTSGAVLQEGDLLPYIDISSLPQGVKFIVVKNDNGDIVYLNKFIKQ